MAAPGPASGPTPSADLRTTVLSSAQQSSLDSTKVRGATAHACTCASTCSRRDTDAFPLTQTDLRLQDSKYLEAHPEVQGMVNAFVQHTLSEKPEDTLAAAVQFFTNPAGVKTAVQAGQPLSAASEGKDA